ncbi:MAG: fused MFS/spermidine synthase [Actinomycetales bacterium]|nr:fused MFS/spermidine synthase [Actinomycetales bacterium]
MARRSPVRRDFPDLPTGPVASTFSSVELSTDTADPDGVLLLLDGVESSYLDLVDPTRLVFEYMQQMAEVLEEVLPEGEGVRAVHLGAAGCAMARAVDARWPGSRQLAVEIDPLLAQYVREWFALPRAPRLRIRIDDARHALTTLREGGFDVVIRDVFAQRVVPEHVRTLEFTREVGRALGPNGLYLANSADHPPLPHARREAATVRSVFAHTAVIVEPGVLRGRRYGNVVLVGSGAPLPFERIERRLRRLPAPATLVHSAALDQFIGTSRPYPDPEPAGGAGRGPAPCADAGPRFGA